MTDNEYNELIKEIEFEKKWLIDSKCTIHDVDIAFDSIIHKLTILKKKECPYYDSEVETCRRSETMAITREDVKNLYEDMMNVVKTEDEKAEMEIIYTLYKGMTDSMQKAVKDIMLVANGKEIEE